MSVKHFKVKTKGNNELNVEDFFRIHVTEPTTITWLLEADGKFNAISSTPTETDGFYFESKTPDGVFGTPTVAPGGKVLTLTDDPTRDKGSYVYKLSATIDNKRYSTTYSEDAGTSNNPTIKNN